MAKRGDALELAVLGLLREKPMHGYELRKRVHALISWTRVLSYGTLYPCLKLLAAQGLISHSPTPTNRTARRARIVYQLTTQGETEFARRMAQAAPTTWDDETFGIHFAFFGQIDTSSRIRVLDGRRSQLAERRADALASLTGRADGYAREWQRHGLEAVEHEIAWLTGLLAAERDPDQHTTTNK